MFVSKLNAQGQFLWAKRFGGIGSDEAYSIAIDSSGNICFTGKYNATVDFDPGPGVINLVSASSSNDVYISKLKSMITKAENITETSDSRIFPNPSGNGQFQILSNQNTDFKVFDLSGKLIAEEMIQPGKNFSISLYPGMYIGKFISKDGVRSTKILAE